MMKRYFCLIAGLAIIIPGLARAQFSATARVGGLPISGATLLNFDRPAPFLPGGIDGAFNINPSSTPFPRVVATSPQNAFEFDDVAYATQVEPVPEPTTRALIACGMGIGFLVLSRKHARKS